MKFLDDQGEEVPQTEIRARVVRSVEELRFLLAVAELFLKDLDEDTLDNDDSFMDFTRPLTNGYSVTGPGRVRVEK